VTGPFRQFPETEFPIGRVNRDDAWNRAGL